MSRKVYWLAQISWLTIMTLYLIHEDAIDSIPICLTIMISVSVIGDIANSALIKWINNHT